MARFAIAAFALLFFVSYVSTTPVNEPAPLDCPPNEKYYKCSLEVCYKTCKHLKIPPPCPSIASGCFKPSCECKKDYLRNEDGICVPETDC